MYILIDAICSASSILHSWNTTRQIAFAGINRVTAIFQISLKVAVYRIGKKQLFLAFTCETDIWRRQSFLASEMVIV